MKEIQARELQRAIKFIEAIGCEYAVVTPDGETFANGLEVVEKKERQRAPLRYAYGEIAKFYKPQINTSAEIGEVQEIALGKFSADDIRRGVCSYLSKEWGRDTYTTNIAEHCVEVLRIA
jgi:hypothetical protein